ncbi:MAG: LysM peptidoglycan-binding domain-containing protein [Bacillota bacterium]|nr:LysM peptidoglycan-binding domain-containing protein [Bacillota bacterium]HHU30156.1 LysM peptidoglycan-binding domain-containing protein [Bacillota bacterium]
MRRVLTGILTVFIVLLLAGQALAASYTVQPGDSLWKIAQRYETTVATLAQLNNLADANYIEAGQILDIPLHKVKAGETLWLISRCYGITVAALAEANRISNVDYIEEGRLLVIPKAALAVSRGGRSSVSAAELDLLAQLVEAEAGGEPYRGQVAVAASVLNRIKSPLYPNSITAVIYQVVNGHYQYSPVLDGRINIAAGESAYRAALEALNGVDPSLGATGFYNPRKTTNQWVRSQPVTVVIGNHVFFR